MDTVSVAAELDSRFGIPGVAEVCEGNGALPRVQITSAFGSGEMYLHGAHVTSWKPAGNNEDEVLFVSTKSRWQEGQAIRGGIPIDEQTRRWWPGEFRLTHRVTFGSELKLELICRNTGTTPLRFEEALHTYNRVAGVEQVHLQGLDTVHFLDNTKANQEKIQIGDVAIASQIDSAYMNTASAVDLLDPKMRRRIRVQKENSLTTVVWNPWREGATGLRDLGDGEWKQFLCVEASNILDSSVNLDPGQEHKMTAVLSVTKL